MLVAVCFGDLGVAAESGDFSRFCETVEAALLGCGSEAAPCVSACATALEDDATSIAKGSIGSSTEVEIFFGFKGCSVVGAAKATLIRIELKLTASNERTNMQFNLKNYSY